jgi:[protein-PII] uridylyltransferase
MANSLGRIRRVDQVGLGKAAACAITERPGEAVPQSAPMTTPAEVEGPAPLMRQASPALAEQVKVYLRGHRSGVEAMIAEGGERSGSEASRCLTKVYDGMLSFLFSTVQAVATRNRSWVPVALAAVGSYGRGRLAYHSDLDVRLVCPEGPQAVQPIAEALLYPMWDAGLALGHQVVDAAEMVELARADLPTATSLLDWRPVAGDPSAARPLLERVFEGVFGAGSITTFLERLVERADDRHARYGGSVYLLEPDVKNGPGGLRDLDVVFWVARARWRIDTLRDLVRVGVLVPREHEHLESAGEALWRIRNLLHLVNGRRSDRLSFDRQEQLASVLGYGDGREAVEHFMSEYYRAARTLTRARDMLVQRAMPRPTRRPHEIVLGRGFKVTSGALSFVHPSALQTTPALALRLYCEAVRRDLPVYGFARDVVTRATSSAAFCERLRTSAEAAELFVKLCLISRRTRLKHASVLQELHDVGLLVAMIPEFAPVVGRVHHDIYHTYTVDVHSVAAVDRLAALCRGELAEEYPLASRLAAEIARPAVLFFAILLHDIGKDLMGGRHWERGCELASVILRRLQLPEADIAEVEHLILKHLRMYHVATCRDIDDPRALEAFCSEVHGREGLRELYLLTVCDVSTTSPGALTNWKTRMLDELYVAADRHLSEGGEPRDLERQEEIRGRVKALWADGSGRAFLDAFLKAVPERYLYANAPAAIVEHARLARDARGAEVMVRLLSSHEPYAEIGVVADDRPGLLAMITAALAAAHLAVVGAQIYSWAEGGGRKRALDLFWVSAGGGCDRVGGLLPRVERDIDRLLRDQAQPSDLVRALLSRSALAERPLPGVRTRINIDNRAASDDTVLEITTQDRQGLLFSLANALLQEGLTISLAKINTEGRRVADVFYVTDALGAKLTDPDRVEHLKTRIVSTIEQLESGVFQ